MFRANMYGPLDRGMVILKLCGWKFSQKETCSVMHFNNALTYALFTFSDRTLSVIKDRIFQHQKTHLLNKSVQIVGLYKSSKYPK